jgi:hypothetical protein
VPHRRRGGSSGRSAVQPESEPDPQPVGVALDQVVAGVGIGVESHGPASPATRRSRSRPRQRAPDRRGAAPRSGTPQARVMVSTGGSTASLTDGTHPGSRPTPPKRARAAASAT